MRRLDWFLAAVVATFLLGALAVQAFGWRPDGFSDPRFPAAASVEATVRRLVIPRIGSPIHANCPAAWAAHPRAEIQS